MVNCRLKRNKNLMACRKSIKNKIVVRQHPLIKDWEVAWEVRKGEWQRGIFKTKKKAMEHVKWIKKVKRAGL